MDADLSFAILFVSFVLIVVSGYNYVARERVTTKARNRRLALLETHESAVTTLDLLRSERGMLGSTASPAVQAVRDWLTQSGLHVRRSTMFTAFCGLFMVVTAIAGYALDFDTIAAPIGFAASLALSVLFIHVMRKRRIAQFSQQLPEVLEMIVRSLRSGHPLPTALSLVARETRDPAGTEFGIVFDEVAYGRDTPSAMRNLARRVGDPDLLYVVTSISVQAESGGNLAEILERLSKTIRERQKLRLKIGALTAEGRISGHVLTALPFIVIGVVSWISPSYFGDVREHPTFIWVAKLSAALLLVGNFTIRKMVNFRY